MAAPSAPAAPLFRSASGAVYVPMPGGDSGLLVSAEGRWIEARPFDPVARRVTGDVRKIDIAAHVTTSHHAGLLSASADLLAYSSAEIPGGVHVAITSRTGADLVIWPEREIGGSFRISPEGGRMARTVLDQVRANPDTGSTISFAARNSRSARRAITTCFPYGHRPMAAASPIARAPTARRR